jgi:carbamoyl-phosphate synthase large subunit
MSVLLTSGGRRVALVRSFQRAVRDRWPGAQVIVADATELSSAWRVADQGVVVPRCDSADYVPALLEIVRRHRIRALVPLIDTELLVLARHREEFSRAGCEAVVSDPAVVEISRDKASTAAHFRELGFRAPATFPPAILSRPDAVEFPVFLKPRAGSSSIGAHRIDDAGELKHDLGRAPDSIVQEMLTGKEYTIDVFSDGTRRVRCAVPRLRIETRAGEISKGRTVKHPVLIDAAARLVNALGGCRGCVTLQCFFEEGQEPVFFEANLRFGGGYPLSDAAGARFPEWTLDLVDGKDVPSFDAWEDGLCMLRYDDAVFFRAE